MNAEPLISNFANDSRSAVIGSSSWLSHYCPTDAYRMAQAGYCACGHAALAAALGRNVDDIQHAFAGPDLWMSDRTMLEAFKILGAMHADVTGKTLNRMAVSWIQGLGSWMRPGVPMGARNQRTHWVATCGDAVYDLNADSWLPVEAWKTQILPDILKLWKTDAYEVRKTFLVWDNDTAMAPPKAD